MKGRKKKHRKVFEYLITHQKFHATPNQILLTAPKTWHNFFKATAKHLIRHWKSHLHSSPLSEHVQAAHSAAVPYPLAGCRAPQQCIPSGEVGPRKERAPHPRASTGPFARTGRKAANTSKLKTGNGGQITLTLLCGGGQPRQGLLSHWDWVGITGFS